MISKDKNKIDQIHRSTDGRFVITYGSDLEISRPASTSAVSTHSSESSDDGGFLPVRRSKMRTSWRRPLVSYPSEMSFGPSITATPQPMRRHRRASHGDGLLQIGNEQQSLLQIVPVELHAIPPTYQNIDSLERTPLRHTLPFSQHHTPSRVSRIISSSPAVSGSSPMANSTTMLSPQTMYFSDLSSVLQASSRDRSMPTPQQNGNISQLRLLQERYAQELPSLRAIHEETQRMMAQYGPHAQMLYTYTPSQYLSNAYYAPELTPPQHQQQQQQQPQSHLHHHINYDDQSMEELLAMSMPSQQPQELAPLPHHRHHHHQPHQQQHQVLVHQRPKSRLLPRHVRMARSAPELGLPHASYMDALEISPESHSHSSSSGFGSRNTSSHAQHNQSSRSGSSIQVGNAAAIANIRSSYLPPYRPPPPPPMYYYYPYDASSTSQHSSPYTMEQWVDLIKQMSGGDSYRTQESQAAAAAAAAAAADAKLDVGSVDGHYEFDPATPTPSASTPTGATTRDDLLLSTALSSPNTQYHYHHQHPYPFPTTTLLQTQSLQPYQRKRVSKYENMEARVQAMKEEFHAYRKRQAMQMQLQQQQQQQHHEQQQPQQHHSVAAVTTVTAATSAATAVATVANANKNSSIELESAC